MGFATALSGLKAASTSLQVTGNNIANSQTTGFKESRAEFADVYASSIGGVSKTQPGSGVKVTEVAQQFNQGNIENTQNSLDLAVSGNGFFVLADNVNLPDPNNPTAPVDPSVPSAYTRNGAFQLNNAGNVVNDKGQYLLAFSPNGTTAADGFSQVFTPLTIDTAQGLPKTTENINMKLNINGAASVPTTPVFDPTEPLSYNNTTSITTYDIQGNAHIASTYYVKTNVANVWNAYLFLDDFGVTTGGPAVPPLVAPASTVASGVNDPGTPIPITFTATGALDQVGNAAIAAAAGSQALAATATAASVAPAATAASVAAAVAAATANSAAAAAAGNAAAVLGGATAASVLAAITGVPAGAGSAVNAAAASAAAVTGATAADVAAAATAAALVDASVTTDTATAAAVVGATPAAVATAAVSLVHVTKVDFGLIDLTAIDPSIGVDPMAFDIDFFGSTQFATPFSVNGLDQDGLPAGNLTGIDVDDTGVVFAKYSNGGSKALGQVALARFQSNQSLAKLGDTTWATTSNSGVPIYGAAGDNNFGGIQSSALEGSNVDLSDQLVKLIIAQQAYQANSQTITTEKTLIETILRV